MAVGLAGAGSCCLAYANAPSWTERDRNYLDEELVNYARGQRMQARDNGLPDPYEKP